LNLPKLAEASAERLGECRVMVHDGTDYTNLQFLDMGKSLHQGLIERDVKKGDMIVMSLINNPLVLSIFQGIFRNGSIAVPVLPTATPHELRYILSDTMANGIITDSSGITKVRTAAKGLKHVRWIWILGGEDDMSETIPEYGLEPQLDIGPKETLPRIDEGDLALLLYTSGTTGKPKGAMLTHDNLHRMALSNMEYEELDTWDQIPITVSSLPLSHIFGVGRMNMSFLIPDHLKHGYTVLMTRFEAEAFMQLIQDHRANRITVVPTMLSLILNHPKLKEYDLTSLVDVTCGSAPLPLEQARDFCRIADINGIREIYGCTECGSITAIRPSQNHPPGSVGKVVQGLEMAVVDDEGHPVPTGKKGEVIARGPKIMKGYLNRPDADAEALRNGWFHTGDIGYLDKDGFLFIVDRKKEMIIKGGENIFPCELEEVLYEHPAVAEAAVVGKPDPIYGESVIGVVVLKQGRFARSEDIIAFMGRKISTFKLPSIIHFVDSLPRSGVGKIMKGQIKERFGNEGHSQNQS
jgi:long-chain acyl-CoA synthetase